MTLDELNNLDGHKARAEFLRCCGSTRWAAAMADARPYGSVAELHGNAAAVWADCREQDWLEAFSAHPRIGAKEKVSAWSKAEQSGMAEATASEEQRLAEGNIAYFEKFGFVFLICATGKSSTEMLQALESRLGNDRPTELINAAREQGKITTLRLEKLLC